MSQFKGTRDDVDFVYIKPVERLEPIQPSTGIMPRKGMGHGMGGMPSPEAMKKRVLEVANNFREKGATSPETAKSLDELDLPPQFKMMMQTMYGESGVFVEDNGRYYLVEEKLSMI